MNGIIKAARRGQISNFGSKSPSNISAMRSLLRVTQNLLRATERAYSSSSTPDRKVAILGAAGGIGQPLSLLMKVRDLYINQEMLSMSLHCLAPLKCITVSGARNSRSGSE